MSSLVTTPAMMENDSGLAEAANYPDDSNDETDENDGESDGEMIVPPDYVYPASFEDG
jgi:hypothetical protein